MLKLYFSPGSCSQASHIALEEAGAVYEAERIDFGKQQQRAPEFLRLNPKGRVPALVTDRGVITESPAILAYIGQSFAGTPIGVPQDPFEFARIQSFNAYLCSTVHVAHAHKRRGSRWADDPAVIEAMTLKVASNMSECFDLIETTMFSGPWVMGETFSIADPYLFTFTSWLEGDGVDPRRFPKVYEHSLRMAERPAVKKVLSVTGG
ncbi:glutathione S-transferase family protein [Rhizobium sp. LjRoot98]|uniref:glutathione S-transferase family protein n=1 Tax=unclassified Rhizobium TaxID=2613769 RepID=UPI0007141380|nr:MULTISPECIES: glutathione S-transferase family protein [unclassified Rhizobium]KQV37408.1 glutathione S-transferase [Rhizobium sp. Root1204]KQY17420.1 glutathione S-transferase [Rhizobium sp. Root1334]KRC13904.1 glutathione S-transferase [Rhizobium sp. Root73]